MATERTGDKKNYQLNAFAIGEGGFGEVLSGKDRRTGQRIAFKKVFPGVRHGKERFEREISVMEMLSHPNIMPLLAADPKAQWFVMPLAEGSLDDLARTLDDAALEECFRQVAEGLRYAHEHDVVHRDITPRNILRIRDSEGVRWVVADWGLVTRPPGETGEPVTRGGLGTEGFAAPEVWAGTAVDCRADIYSLGRVIAWALTRSTPLPNVDLPAPGKWRPLVAKMTAPDRESRHANIAALLQSIASLHASAGSSYQLIALGPNIVGHGELQEVAGKEWSVEIHNLVVGDDRTLVQFSDMFDELPGHDRYVTVERDGEARVLTSPPRLTRKGSGWLLQVSVGPRHPRPHIDTLHADMSLEDLEEISGREQLPQIFYIALSTSRGELRDAPEWGNDLRQRFAELGDTELFERLVGLEAMRMASIPYVEDDGLTSTALRCVDRIVSLKLGPAEDPNCRSAKIVADVSGIGRWEGEAEFIVRTPEVEPDLVDTDTDSPPLLKGAEEILAKSLDQILRPATPRIPRALRDAAARASARPASTDNAIDGVKSNARDVSSRVKRFMTELYSVLDALAPAPGNGMTDDEPLLKAITASETAVLAFGEVVEIAASHADDASAQAIYRGFERSAQMCRRDVVDKRRDTDRDFHRFLAHELFVVFVAALMRHEQWEIIQRLLSQELAVQTINGPANVPFQSLSVHARLFDARNGRLQLGRASLRADILTERHGAGAPLGAVCDLESFLDADYFLFLRAELPPELSPVSENGGTPCARGRPPIKTDERLSFSCAPKASKRQLACSVPSTSPTSLRFASAFQSASGIWGNSVRTHTHSSNLGNSTFRSSERNCRDGWPQPH